MHEVNLNPLERLILVLLRFNSPKTSHELFVATGAKAWKYFVRTLRSLRMAGFVVKTKVTSVPTTYSLLPVVKK